MSENVRRFFAAVARAPQRRGLRRGAGGGTLEGGDHHGEGATGLALGGWEVTPGEAQNSSRLGRQWIHPASSTKMLLSRSIQVLTFDPSETWTCRTNSGSPCPPGCWEWSKTHRLSCGPYFWVGMFLRVLIRIDHYLVSENGCLFIYPPCYGNVHG